MNTNQIPPGILKFDDNGHTYRLGKHVEDYDHWVKFNLDKGYTIHTISVDGTEWSVGDESSEGIIKGFYWETEEESYLKGGAWMADFGDGPDCAVQLLTKPLPHSGGDFGAFLNSKRSDLSGNFEKDFPPTNQGEAGGKRKDDEIFHNQVIADIILEIKRSPQIVSEQRYNAWYCRILAEMQEYSRQQLKEKQGWSDEDMKCAYIEGQDAEYELVARKTQPKPANKWLNEYKSKTGNNQINQM